MRSDVSSFLRHSTVLNRMTQMFDGFEKADELTRLPGLDEYRGVPFQVSSAVVKAKPSMRVKNAI